MTHTETTATAPELATGAAVHRYGKTWTVESVETVGAGYCVNLVDATGARRTWYRNFEARRNAARGPVMATCGPCGAQLEREPGAGWVDATEGGTYDLCPASPTGLGAHRPERDA